MLPTFIDLFKFQVQKDYAFDGISLTPVLRSNKKMDNRMFVVQHGGQVRPEKYFSCVVWDSWRLVGENELYNIEKDPGQKKNVANEFPDVLAKMKSFYEKWWKEIKDGVDQFVPHIIDSEKQNPVILNASNWTEGAVNSQWRIARADGASKGGICHIHVVNAGKYRVELSRWPFHLERDMVLPGPSTTVGGASLRVGKGVPVEYGCLSVNDGKPVIVRKNSTDASKITFETELPSGDITFQGWFKDKNRKDLCGAYYVRVGKIGIQ